MIGGVYKIDFPSKKSYIGMTKHSIQARIAGHFDDANQKGGRKYAVHNAIKKYGEKNCRITILFKSSDPKILAKEEIRAIKKHNTISPNGYNLTSGGEGLSDMPKKCRIKAGLKAKERWKNPDFKRKMLLAHKAWREDKKSIFNSKEYRDNLIKKQKQAWADPNSGYNSKSWKEKRSEAVKKMWKRKGLKEKISRKTSKAVKKLWADPVWRAKTVHSIKIAMNNPETINKLSKAAKNRKPRRQP